VMAHVKLVCQKSQQNQKQLRSAALTAKMFDFCCSINQDKWDKAFKEVFIADDQWMARIRTDGSPDGGGSQSDEIERMMAKGLSSKPDLLKSFLERKIDGDVRTAAFEGEDQLEAMALPLAAVSCTTYSESQQLDYVRIAEVLDNVTTAAKNLKIGDEGSLDLAADIVELGDFRLDAQRRQMESLQSSLNAADQRIASISQLNECLEQEKCRQSGVIARLLRRLSSLERELSDVRVEYRDFESTNSHSLKEANAEIADKTDKLEKAEAEGVKLAAKTAKLKDNVKQLQEAILEYQDSQRDLQDKLKTESKNNADLTVALAKREEKLKKSVMRLEEERSEREGRERQLEALKKEVESLQSLTKRQEQVMAKKDKQIQELNDEIIEERKRLELIFNMSKRK